MSVYGLWELAGFLERQAEVKSICRTISAEMQQSTRERFAAIAHNAFRKIPAGVGLGMHECPTRRYESLHQSTGNITAFGRLLFRTRHFVRLPRSDSCCTVVPVARFVSTAPNRLNIRLSSNHRTPSPS